MDTMSYFLVEIRMVDAQELELERAARTLEAAQIRLRRTAIATRTVIVGLIREDQRLVYVFEAASLETVRFLVSMAFLPAGRIREITHVTDRSIGDSQARG
jgi:hypothetical protein